MATADTSSDHVRTSGVTTRSSYDETKPSFKTTELITMVVVVAGILIASAVADNFDAPRAWTLVAAVASAYMIARAFLQDD